MKNSTFYRGSDNEIFRAFNGENCREVPVMKILLQKIPELMTVIMLVTMFTQKPKPYFTYALAAFIVFLVYDYYISRKEGRDFLPSFPKRKEIKILLLGLAVFYGLVLLANILLMDKESIIAAVNLAYYSLPLFLFWWLRSRYPVEKGIEWGTMIGTAFCGLTGWWMMYQHIQDRMYGGPLLHPNLFGAWLTMTIPMTCYFFFKEKLKWQRAILFLSVVFQMYCFYETDSRGTFAAFAIGIPASIVISLLITGRKVDSAVKKYLAVLAIVSFMLAGGFFYYRQQDLDAKQQTGGERILMLQASVEMWKDHKLMGVGTARWKENYYSPRYFPKKAQERTNSMPHNMPVFFLSTSGLIGLAGYIVSVMATFWSLILLGKRTELSISITLFAIFFVFLLHGFVDKTIIHNITAQLYYSFMGYLFAVSSLMPEKS